MSQAPLDRLVALPGRPALAVRSWTGPGPDRYLLVHGLASNLAMWDGVAAELAASGATVHAVDLRGHGRSEKPEQGYRTDEVLADLLALVTALGGAPYVWAGQSWGGNLVVELAARRPELVRAVCGVDGGFLDLQQRFPRWPDCREQLAPPPSTGLPLTELERRFRGAHPSWPETGINGALGCFEVRADGTVAPWLTLPRHLEVLRGLWEHHPGPALAALTMPALLLLARTPGAAAFATEKQHAVERLTQTAPKVQVRWLEGDHDLHAQHPSAVAAALVALAEASGD
ncbi:MAG TPA: alpha/beta hydrolase [Mycobacteriales bacterium]|nr:alpha/beta hydrolase [Mycobacteriales bacterium]